MKTLTEQMDRCFNNFAAGRRFRKDDFAWLMRYDDARQLERESGINPNIGQVLFFRGIVVVEASNLPPGAPRVGIVRTDTLYPEHSGALLN